ncbi:hypothetical protein BDZ89DRAFT_1060718 [Hymenopellis radicata]|nr:hypothetical protein BDZ89DRAFT_1060718 [Hymenopellis radicata]
MEHDGALSSLVLLMLAFAFLLAAAIMWCFLSSCMGVSAREFLSTIWESAVLSSQTTDIPGRRRRARPFGEGEEVWEMEYRGRGA